MPPDPPLSAAAAAAYELRTIILLQGIQFNNKDDSPDYAVPDGYLSQQLNAAGLNLNKVSDTHWTVRVPSQGVIYALRVLTDKKEMKKSLEGSKKVHVIYDGHSRYGRGCCFGTDASPGENWENGSDDSTGLFRMGFPYVGVPLQDVVHHGYHLDVVPISEKVSQSDCEKDLRDHVSSLRPLKLSDVRGIFKSSDGDVDLSLAKNKLLIRKSPVSATDKFWGFNWPGEGLTVVTHAGWTGTSTDPADLGATTMGCRCFCHFGCESFQHYHDVVRNLKSWTKVGDTDNFAYFTSNIAYSVTTSFWLHRLFTYDKYNASKPWEASLEYARTNANKDLKKWCAQEKVSLYQIV